MSCLVMRPPSPVPEICERLTPCSRAILRTSGEERASSSSEGSWAGGAAAVGADVAAAAGFFSSFFWLLLLEPALLELQRGRRFRGRGGFAIHGDGADDCIHADCCPFSDFDLLQNSGGGRGNFGVNFVSGDFEERFVALDFVARLLQPFGNSALDDGFAHLGHDDVSRHDFLPRGPRFWTRA